MWGVWGIEFCPLRGSFMPPSELAANTAGCSPGVWHSLQDTAERLRAVEEHLLEGRAYLAARSTLRDMF